MSAMSAGMWIAPVLPRQTSVGVLVVVEFDGEGVFEIGYGTLNDHRTAGDLVGSVDDLEVVGAGKLGDAFNLPGLGPVGCGELVMA